MKLEKLLNRRREKIMSKFNLTAFVTSLLLAGVMSTAQAQMAEGELRIGYRTDARPMSYRDESGSPAGYSVELCKRVVQDIQAKRRLTVEYVALTAQERGDALLEGRVDILCGADTVTLSRREAVSFSIPVFVGGIGALLRTDAPSRLRALLAGEEPEYRPRWRASFGQILKQRTFAVIEGSAAQDWLAESIDEFDIIADTVTVGSYEEGVELVARRDADVLFADRAILLGVARQAAPSSKLYVVGRRFTDELLALTVRRGEDDLRLTVDRTLSELFRSGEVYEIYEEFFGDASEETRLLYRLGAIPE